MVAFRNNPMVRSVKSLWALEMEPFQNDTDSEPIKVSSAEVLTSCVKWMLSRGWLLGSLDLLNSCSPKYRNYLR